MTTRRTTRIALAATAAVSVGGFAAFGLASNAIALPSHHSPAPVNNSGNTTTPIKHVVVLYDENVSFDHYFGTYPNAANTDGVKFTAAKGTPRANTEQNAGLLKNNPNLEQPFRLTPAQAVTCDQNHSYLPEQKATDGGKNDKFVQFTSQDTCTGAFQAPGLAMGYYDGNTVTAEWNYAQHYAMSDDFFGSTYGPSTPGALNLIAGQTYGMQAVNPTTLKPTSDSYVVSDPNSAGVGTVTNDPDPAFDDCSDTNHTSSNNLGEMSGLNIGNLLNEKGVTWGWFQGGFAPTSAASSTQKYAVCGAAHENVNGESEVDYSPHHDPFQYFKSTSNPHHLAPKSLAEIGHNGQANHNYDLSYFQEALNAGDLPAVSFLKAPEYEDGHAGYSDPIDEEHFITGEINAIEKSKDWSSTAIVITYDDSDGWYDHQASKVLTGSSDATLNTSACQAVAANPGAHQDRCGPGPRLPFLVISPYSRQNYIGNTPLEQASIIKFIEQNWRLPQIGDGSFDSRAASFASLLDFRGSRAPQVLLKSDGAVASVKPTGGCGGHNPGHGHPHTAA